MRTFPEPERAVMTGTAGKRAFKIKNSSQSLIIPLLQLQFGGFTDLVAFNLKVLQI